MWIHLSCTNFKSSTEAEEHKHVFRCRKCEDKNETPKATNKYEDLKIKNVEDLKDEVLLLGTGTHNFYGNISKTDIKSLDDGKWVTDNVISHIQKYSTKCRPM